MSQIRLKQGNKELTVNVRSVNCRYIDLDFKNDMSIEMKVPLGMTKDMIESYVHLNEEHIFREHERIMKRNHQSLPATIELEDGKVRYQSGMSLPFLGRMDTILRIRCRSDLDGVSMYVSRGENQARYLIIKTDVEDQDLLRYCVMRYYKKCAEKIVRKTLEYYSKKMDLTCNSFRIIGLSGETQRNRFPYAGFASKNIDIKNQLTIWGSCSRKKNLKFDWKLAMLPLEVIEYIVVHELTHLKIMNHSRAFWKEVAGVMPEYAECQSWLSKHGKEYEIF